MGMNFSCPHCGLSYDLTPEYVAEFGGQDTACTSCGNAFQIPSGVTPDPVEDSAAAIPLLNYAAPALVTKPVTGAWQDRGSIVFIRGKSLPRRCPKCGAAAIGKITWLRFSFRPAHFVGFGIAANAIKSAVTEETSLGVYFCPTHYRRYHTFSWLLSLTGICGMIGIFVVGTQFPNPSVSVAAPVLGIVVLIAGLVFGTMMRRNMAIVAADKRFAWLNGCATEFVESLPDLKSVQEAESAATAEKLEQMGDV